VQGLAAQAGNERFAWDSYRRLVQMFGKTGRLRVVIDQVASMTDLSLPTWHTRLSAT
jgi:dGTP triphosphohydrolase